MAFKQLTWYAAMYIYCDVLRHGCVRCSQVILTPTCRVSDYPRQVIEVDTSWTTTLYLDSANNSYNAYNDYTTRHLWHFELVYLPLRRCDPTSPSLFFDDCLSLPFTDRLYWLLYWLSYSLSIYYSLLSFLTLTAWAEWSLLITLDLPNRRHRFQPFGCWFTVLIDLLRDFSRQRSVRIIT
jgi:hypothetical protein